MCKTLELILGLTLCCLIAFTTAGQITVPNGFQLRRIAGNLNPTDLTVAPDGRVFLLEKQGVVRVIENDVLLNIPAFTVPNINTNNERGLLGIALDPDFGSNGYIYVHYTYTNGSNYSQVSRFTLSGNTAVAKSQVVIITLDKHDTNGGVHNGGAIRIDASGKLFMFVGNIGNGGHSQDMTLPYGKALRFNLDGSIPTDNPFYGSSTGNTRAIWANGLRNPFMAAYDSKKDRIMIGDVGEGAWEEINLNKRGANFGFQNAEGFSDNAAFTNPEIAYSHSYGCSIAGLSFYQAVTGDFSFPSSYNSNLFFSDYCGGWIRAFNPDTTRSSNTDIDSFAPKVVQGLAGALTMAQGTDGGLYFVDRGTHSGATDANTGVSTGVLYKLVYTGSSAPYIHTQPYLPTLASGNSDGKLYVGVTGAPTLTFQWYKNGQPIPGATSDTHVLLTVTLQDDGTEYYVNVSNSQGSVRSDTFVLKVSEGQPVLTINSPASTLTYKAGDTIQFSGTAEDPSKTSLAVWWTIVFHHQDHTHPFLGPIFNETNGEFTLPTDFELDPVQWYRIHFEAENAKQLTSSVYVDIQPELGSFDLYTDPEGLSVFIDDVETPTPNLLTGVKGMRRLVRAPQNQTLNGKTYYFMGWNDREGPEHYVTFFGSKVPLVAAYETGINRAIWAYGFRNSFMTTYDPVNDQTIFGDVGESTWEELNLNQKGANYGWPFAEGLSIVQQNYSRPELTYKHDAGCAITGLAFYMDSDDAEYQFPEQYIGKLLFGDYCKGWIRYIDIYEDIAVRNVTVKNIDTYAPVLVQGTVGGLSMTQGLDGGLYFAERGTSNGASTTNVGVLTGSIYKLIYTGSKAPVIYAPLEQWAPLPTGKTYTLFIGATGAALNYTWYRDDNIVTTARTNTFAIALTALMNGTRYRVDVSNPFGIVTSNEVVLLVSGNTGFGASIWTSQSTYSAGDVIEFGVTITDPTDDPLRLISWIIELSHQKHTHPFASFANIESGNITIPHVGELDPVQGYVFTVFVHNSVVSINTKATISPNLGTVTLKTDPPGLGLIIDEVDTYPVYELNITGVVSMQRTFYAPGAQSIGNDTYVFVGWSDGDTNNEKSVPFVIDSVLTLQANYCSVVECPDLPLAPVTERAYISPPVTPPTSAGPISVPEQPMAQPPTQQSTTPVAAGREFVSSASRFIQYTGAIQLIGMFVSSIGIFL